MVDKKNVAKSGTARDRKKTLILLDAHAIIHRAYHALPDFTSNTGEPTGALYGLSSMLMKIIRELNPDYLAACFDMAAPTFRHDAYEDYKGKRKKTDQDLSAQINRSYEVFKAFNIPVYEYEGFEADDVIGTIAKDSAREKNLEVIIASGDMDTLQLVEGKRVRVYTLRKGITDTIIYDEKKVEERFGFSPELLPDFKGLRGDPSDNIPGIAGIGEKTATLLIKEFGSIPDMYKILKKDRNVFLKAGVKERIVKLLEEGEEDAMFSKELAQIRFDAPVNYKVPRENWTDSFTKGKVEELFKDLSFKSLLARLNEQLPDNTKKEEKKKNTEPGSEEVEKVGIALWLISSNITNPEHEDILEYAHTDSFEKAKKIIFSKLKKDGLESVYKDIELPLMPVLKKMEDKGILIDAIILKSLSKKYHKEVEVLEKEIWKLAGEEFNINSPKQLSEVLFDKMGLSGSRRTATGQKSTRAGELERLKDKHPIIEELLAYRELQKLLSTYIDNIPDMADKDGRLRADFIQTGTATGRFASQNPNMQNIPVRSELGREIRRGFIAEKGHMLIAFDYSQIELRIAALLSGDKKLKKIFKDGLDVHKATAAEMFKIPLDDVNSDMRRAAKTINFGILYGMGVNALRQNLGVDREKAQKFYTTYYATFKELAVYLEKTKKDAGRLGYTKTYFGRRRYYPGIKSPLPYIRAMEERMAINAPIQGTSADMVKLSMSRIDSKLREEKLDGEAHLLLQIHDELIYEVKENKRNEVVPLIKNEMESVLKTDIKFVVDVSTGYNWGEMKKI